MRSRRQGDPFGDPFFSRGAGVNDIFGALGQVPTFNASNTGRRGVTKSVSTTTQMINGQARTIKTIQQSGQPTIKEVYHNGNMIEKWENNEKVFDALAIGDSNPQQALPP